ncbi:hypothetical protein [Thauera aromatica]|uniref:hypothetical protein n=1 Tax=Thauera aromatica TaxID=59405 RepID=UPI001FFCF83E|nr:hypothetical protein [Thauera aromatica]MCK2095624.1 hypothetical protein [Thauera aromatica]
MPAPASATYSVATLVAAHTAFRDLVDAGLAAGSIKIRDAADVLLAQVPLTYPCGTINGTTGQLTITPDGRDESADADGTAAYAEVCASDGTVHLALPAQQGTSAVSGKIVLNSLSIVTGGPVEVLSAVIG